MKLIGRRIGTTPCELVLGWQLDVSKYPDVQIRLYVEASYDNIATNDMTDRNHRCIALERTGNFQGYLIVLI